LHFGSDANTNKIEKIQERALRFIYNDYNSTYENLLIVSKLPTLKVRRLRTEVYKILHKESPSYLHDLIKLKSIQSKKAAVRQISCNDYSRKNNTSSKYCSGTSCHSMSLFNF
jgi:hypothetical protein